MTSERWRPVEGFEGLYEVSDEGRVRSLPRVVPFRVNFFRSVRGGIKSLTVDKDGYLQVSLSKHGVPYARKVHRLVAGAFMDRSDIDVDVNHKDAIKHNNHWENLEWCTHKENSEHAAGADLMAFGSRHGSAKLVESDIPVIRQLFYQGWSYRAIAENFEVAPATISDVIKGKTWVRA